MQSLEKIVIDPERCPNVTREFSEYELERDTDGEFKSVYPDKNNHTIDAVRYALEDEITKKKVCCGKTVYIRFSCLSQIGILAYFNRCRFGFAV